MTGRYEDVAVNVVRQQLPGGTCRSLSILNYLWVTSPGDFPTIQPPRNAESKEGIIELLQDKYALRPGMFGVPTGVMVGRRDQLNYFTDSLSPRLNNYNEISGIDKFGERWPKVNVDHSHDLSEENLHSLNTIQNLLALTPDQLQNLVEHVGPRKRNHDLFPLSLPLTPSSSGTDEYRRGGNAPVNLFEVLDPKAQHNRSSTTRTIRSSSSISSATKGTTVKLHVKLKKLTPGKLKTLNLNSPVSSKRSSKAPATAPYQEPYRPSASSIDVKAQHAGSNDSVDVENFPISDIVNANVVDDSTSTGVERHFLGTLPQMQPVQRLKGFIETPATKKSGLLLSPSLVPPSSFFNRCLAPDCAPVQRETENNQNTSIYCKPLPAPHPSLDREPFPDLPSPSSDLQPWNEHNQKQVVDPLGSGRSLPSTPIGRPTAVASNDRFSPIYLQNGIVHLNGVKRYERDQQSPSEERASRRNMSRQKMGLDPILPRSSMENTTSHPYPSGSSRRFSGTPDSAHLIREVVPLARDSNEATHNETRIPYLMNRNGAHTVYSRVTNKVKRNDSSDDDFVYGTTEGENLENPFVIRGRSPSNVYTSMGLSRELLFNNDLKRGTSSFNQSCDCPPPVSKLRVPQHRRVKTPTQSYGNPFQTEAKDFPIRLQHYHKETCPFNRVLLQPVASYLPVGRVAPLHEHASKPVHMPHWSTVHQGPSYHNPPLPVYGMSQSYSEVQTDSSYPHSGPDDNGSPIVSIPDKYMQQIVDDNTTMREIINEAKLRASKAEDRVKELQSERRNMVDQNGELRWANHLSIQVLLSRDKEIVTLQQQVELLKKERDDIRTELEHVIEDRDVMEVHWQELDMRGLIPADLCSTS